ncbi:MAG: hypothetical protein AAF739_14490 [Pseudomonadota bacterium]
MFAALGSPVVQAQGLTAEAVAQREESFGRLQLTFADRLDLPPHEIEVENGVLRVVFEQPVDTDIRDAIRVLSDFVTIARRDPDGRALRLGLARSVRINTMEAGETLFIDFLPSNWQGFPPPLPQEVVQRLADRAEEAAREAAIEERQRLLGELQPEVSLRVGSAPTFTRYSFDWSVPFDVDVTQSGSTLEVVFGYDVPIDLSAALIDQPAELEDISAERDGLELAITFEVAPGSRVRWFEDDLSFVVDLDREEAARPRTDSEAIAEALEALVPDSADANAARFEATVERELETITQPSEDAVAQVQAGAPQLSTLEPGERVDRDSISVVPPSPGDDDSLASAAAARPPEVSGQQTQIDVHDSVIANLRTDDDLYVLTLPFIAPTPAAIFERAGVLTLAFETDSRIDLTPIQAELSPIAESIAPTRLPGAYMINIRLRQDLMVSAEPSENRWIISFGPQVEFPPQPLDINRGTYPDGRAFAEVLAQGLGTPLHVTHPEVRDRLVLIPVSAPTRAVLATQSLVDFEVLSSASGIVVRPLSEDLIVEVEPGRAEISREGGLRLSEVGLSLGSFGFSPTERLGYFDMRRFLGQGPGSFEPNFATYHNEIAMLDGLEKSRALLEFARFLLSFELGQEANGALDIAVDLDPSLEHDPSFLMLKSAALTMAGRFELARQLLTSHAMADYSDAAIWKVLTFAGLRDWPAVNTHYEQAALLFDDYPGSIVTQLRLAGTEAAFQTRAVDLARERLSQIDPLRIGEAERGIVHLLDAQLALAKGRTEEAIAGFEAVRQKDPGPAGAEATLHSIAARYRSGQIEVEAAIEELENLAVAWRGDDTEVEARSLLADLYTAQDQYSDALLALKGVVVAQPDHPKAADVTDRMQDIFVDLFLDGKADALDAIDALSLFYDFRELTPIGRRGDELVRRLVGRMVELDLLDQAADLLEHQVSNRLSGVAQAQVSGDLALIYLMDYRPAEAVAVLQRSRLSQVPMAIERGRRIIEARALSELGRYDLALEVLRSLEGDDVAEVRSDILWNAERWQEAGEQLERMLADRWADRVPLLDEEMHHVLRAAIAYSFAGEDYALRRLRARFDQKMSDGVFASAFDVVTSPISERGTAFRDIARSVAGVNTLSRFLDDYRAAFTAPSDQAIDPEA